MIALPGRAPDRARLRPYVRGDGGQRVHIYNSTTPDPVAAQRSERRDSNPRPSAPEADALPSCATLRKDHTTGFEPVALTLAR